MIDGWTKEWPTEPGWYWTFQRGHRESVRPVEVRIAGDEKHHLVLRVRDGGFLHIEEQQGRSPVWWKKMENIPTVPEELLKGK